MFEGPKWVIVHHSATWMILVPVQDEKPAACSPGLVQRWSCRECGEKNANIRSDTSQAPAAPERGLDSEINASTRVASQQKYLRTFHMLPSEMAPPIAPN